jgi:hypothetical protein
MYYPYIRYKSHRGPCIRVSARLCVRINIYVYVCEYTPNGCSRLVDRRQRLIGEQPCFYTVLFRKPSNVPLPFSVIPNIIRMLYKYNLALRFVCVSIEDMHPKIVFFIFCEVPSIWHIKRLTYHLNLRFGME